LERDGVAHSHPLFSIESIDKIKSHVFAKNALGTQKG